VRCETCDGQGRVRRVQRSFFGQFVNVGACPTCGGAGTTVVNPCAECGGEGRLEGDAEVSVEIPPGVDTGDYLTVRGAGDAGARGTPAGNLIVVFEVEMPEGFERHGQDLLVQLPISPARAALGGKLTVPTMDGTATLNVPAGVQHEALLRLKGKGVPSLRGFGRGHQFVRILIEIPQELDRKRRKLYEQLLELERDPGAE
jgi:molecular chaperone DnaJ